MRSSAVASTGGHLRSRRARARSPVAWQGKGNRSPRLAVFAARYGNEEHKQEFHLRVATTNVNRARTVTIRSLTAQARSSRGIPFSRVRPSAGAHWTNHRTASAASADRHGSPAMPIWGLAARQRCSDVGDLGPKRRLCASSNHTDGRTKLVLPLRIHVLLIHFTEKRCSQRIASSGPTMQPED